MRLEGRSAASSESFQLVSSIGVGWLRLATPQSQLASTQCIEPPGWDSCGSQHPSTENMFFFHLREHFLSPSHKEKKMMIRLIQTRKPGN